MFTAIDVNLFSRSFAVELRQLAVILYMAAAVMLFIGLVYNPDNKTLATITAELNERHAVKG